MPTREWDELYARDVALRLPCLKKACKETVHPLRRDGYCSDTCRRLAEAIQKAREKAAHRLHDGVPL